MHGTAAADGGAAARRRLASGGMPAPHRQICHHMMCARQRPLPPPVARAQRPKPLASYWPAQFERFRSFNPRSRRHHGLANRRAA